MVWLFYAVMAPFIFAFVNIFDKLLRDKHLGTFTLSILVGLSAFWILLIIPFVDFSFSPALAVVGLIVGALFFAGVFPYFQALSIEEASRVIPLWALEAPIVLILAYVFLKERLLINDYIGFALVVAGAFLILTRKLGDTLKPGKAFFLMLLASCFTSAAIVISKWLYSETSFWTVQLLLGLGTGLAALLILQVFATKKREFFNEVSALKRLGFLQFGARQLFFIVGGLVFSLAIMTGSASLSAALVQLSALYVFIMATVLSRFLPHILEEKIDKKTLLTKAAAILMIIAGVFAINL